MLYRWTPAAGWYSQVERVESMRDMTRSEEVVIFGSLLIVLSVSLLLSLSELILLSMCKWCLLAYLTCVSFCLSSLIMLVSLFRVCSFSISLPFSYFIFPARIPLSLAVLLFSLIFLFSSIFLFVCFRILILWSLFFSLLPLLLHKQIKFSSSVLFLLFLFQ